MSSFIVDYMIWAILAVFTTFVLFIALVKISSTGILDRRTITFLCVAFGQALWITGHLGIDDVILSTPALLHADLDLVDATAVMSQSWRELLFISLLCVAILVLYKGGLQYTRPIELLLLLTGLFIGGVGVLGNSTLIDIFIGLELVGFASYTMVALGRDNKFSIHGGIQYVVVSAIPTGVLLIGMTLLYYVYGSMSITDIMLLQEAVSTSSHTGFLSPLEDASPAVSGMGSLLEDVRYVMVSDTVSSAILTVFSSCILFAALFKLGAAPIHVWILEVYAKAPTLIFATLTTIGKVVALGMCVRIVYLIGGFNTAQVYVIITISALGTLLVGTFGASTTVSLKRYFVFAGIGHIGYILLLTQAVSCFTAGGFFTYMLVYVIGTVLFWGVLISFISTYAARKSLYTNTAYVLISSLSSIRERSYIGAILVSAVLFSICALPPFGGFFVKLDILMAIMDVQDIFAVGLIVLIGVPATFYYLRVVKVLLFNTSTEGVLTTVSHPEVYGTVAVQSVLILLFWIITAYVAVLELPVLELLRVF